MIDKHIRGIELHCWYLLIEITNIGMNMGINGLTNVGKVLTFWNLESACVRLGHMCTLDRRFSKNLKNRFSPLTHGSQETQRTGSHPRLTVLKKSSFDP